MTSETGSVAKSGQESVVLASFDSYRHAEHMLASLGGEFRRKARKGGARAVVVRDNPDGSRSAGERCPLQRLKESWHVTSALAGSASPARG